MDIVTFNPKRAPGDKYTYFALCINGEELGKTLYGNWGYWYFEQENVWIYSTGNPWSDSRYHKDRTLAMYDLIQEYYEKIYS